MFSNAYKLTIGLCVAGLLTGLLTGCEDEGSSTIHHQGTSCKNCHSFNGATVFNNLHDADSTTGASGYTVQLGGADGYSKSNGIGNSSFYGQATLPKFTAHVRDSNGNIVNSSLENSHDNTRLDCNRCHTQAGANGAPGRIVSKKL